MRPFFYLLLTSLVSIVTLSACGASHPAYLYTRPQRDQLVEEFGECNTDRTYGYAEAQTGEFKGFSATVHSQVILGKKKLTAEQVAQVAWSMFEATNRKWPFNYLPKDKKDKIYHMLKNTHVIVAKDNEELQRVWGPYAIDMVLNGRMQLSKKACFEPVNNTYFFTITAERFTKDDVSTLTHEMTHAVSSAVFNEDPDVGHRNPDLWEEISDESIDSVANKIFNNLKNFLKEKENR